ncbi:MAG: beta-Ala-His dipeptidase [Clostridia bacterium]|nr:beta-Ala-His dipeptidase [Clostridia bacterium]
MDYSSYKCRRMLEYFEEISKIPRASYKEDKIADYLCNFAKERGIYCVRDAFHNVFMRIQGTQGREDEPPVLLQGHTDMVCEAEFGIEWNTRSEGVKTYVEGDFIKADGTTLGGDDGAAVGAMLAILDGALASHPPIECLFTTCEEVGLDGMKNFDMSNISARRMINLDSETEGEAVISCAGGVRTDIFLRTDFCSFDRTALKITVKGLCGGHSGADIHLGRANANKVLATVLKVLMKDTRTNIAGIFGGTKDNAITRSAEAVISVKDVNAAKEAVGMLYDKIKATLSEDDRASFDIICEKTEAPDTMCGHETGVALVKLLSLLPCGVMEWIDEDRGMVESSCNIGVVSTDDEGFRIIVSSRSNDEAKLDGLVQILDNFAQLYGCRIEHRNRYPGWKNANGSPVESLYKNVYRSLFGVYPNICAIHAGLECGLVKKAIPDMDIISIGPTILDIHTPRERMSLSSCDKFWLTLEKMLMDRA